MHGLEVAAIVTLVGLIASGAGGGGDGGGVSFPPPLPPQDEINNTASNAAGMWRKRIKGQTVLVGMRETWRHRQCLLLLFAGMRPADYYLWITVATTEGTRHMRTSRSLIVLTVLNSALVAFLLIQQLRPAFAASEPQVLRGRGLEIVDSQGQVRASITVFPPDEANGGRPSETVLLRLITEKGRPSVKISASEPSSGLSFAGPTGTKNTYVILQAGGMESELKLRNEDGSERDVKP